MNHTITKNGNDFKVEAMEQHDIDYEPILMFPKLKIKVILFVGFISLFVCGVSHGLFYLMSGDNFPLRMYLDIPLIAVIAGFIALFILIPIIDKVFDIN